MSVSLCSLSGLWLRCRAGRNRAHWKKSKKRLKRLKQFVFCSKNQSKKLDLMVTSYWKSQKNIPDDPFAPFENRNWYGYKDYPGSTYVNRMYKREMPVNMPHKKRQFWLVAEANSDSNWYQWYMIPAVHRYKPDRSDTDMPTSGNTNLYFEAHKPVFFNKNLYFLKTYTNRLPLPHFITRIFIYGFHPSLTALWSPSCANTPPWKSVFFYFWTPSHL